MCTSASPFPLSLQVFLGISVFSLSVGLWLSLCVCMSLSLDLGLGISAHPACEAEELGTPPTADPALLLLCGVALGDSPLSLLISLTPEPQVADLQPLLAQRETLFLKDTFRARAGGSQLSLQTFSCGPPFHSAHRCSYASLPPPGFPGGMGPGVRASLPSTLSQIASPQSLACWATLLWMSILRSASGRLLIPSGDPIKVAPMHFWPPCYFLSP